MTVTITADTPRPLAEEPFSVEVLHQACKPRLFWRKVNATQELIAEEYAARFLGEGTHEISIDGEVMYGI